MRVPREGGSVPSLTQHHPNALFYEREFLEMFGVNVTDLKKAMMDAVAEHLGALGAQLEGAVRLDGARGSRSRLFSQQRVEAISRYSAAMPRCRSRIRSTYAR